MKGFLKLNKILDQGSQKLLSRNFYFGLLLIAIFLFVLDFKVHTSFKEEAVLGAQYTPQQAEYPILGTSTYMPQISAKGAVVMDADSGVVLYSKNPNLRFSPASTTKIMTALTALSYFNLNDILTVKNASTEGVILGLKTGQKVSFQNLLYALLLPSANDVALTIAQNYPSSSEGFVKEMNKNAVKFNLFNTHYQDPAGLEDDGDYTTPLDLARLSSIAIKNKTFAKIVSTKEKIIEDAQGNSYSLKNLNKLLGIDDVNGIKTGSTVGAGQVLVTSQKVGDHTTIIVVMDSLDRFLDTQNLLGKITGNIIYLPIRL